MGQYYQWDYDTDSFEFFADPEKCIHCGLCMEVCSTQILRENEEGNVIFPPEDDGHVGWGGCYTCQRCMAVCPTGAITIFGKDPADSVSMDAGPTPEQFDALIKTRRSCRHFKDEELPRELIDEMLHELENLPTSSGLQSLEFAVTYSKEETAKFRRFVRKSALEYAERGIYPGVFGPREFQNQLDIEPGRNQGDVFMSHAPHMLIISSKKKTALWQYDPHFADVYWDLICQSRGIGSLFMSLPCAVLNNVPEARELLGLPEERHFDIIMGFGYPAVKFARGVQRENRIPIRELKFPTLD